MAETQQEKIEQQQSRMHERLAQSHAMMAMPDSPLTSVSRALTRVIDETVKQATLEREDLLRQLAGAQEHMEKFAVAWWDKEHRTLLLTPHLLEQVPDAVYLVSITGERKLAAQVREEGDKDTRFGVTAWGIPLDNAKAPPTAPKRIHRKKPVAVATPAETNAPEPPKS